MNDEIETIIPLKMSSKMAKQFYKETDGLKRLLSKTSGINEDLLGPSSNTKNKCAVCGKNHLKYSMYSCSIDQ